jgi:hypothetical protein
MLGAQSIVSGAVSKLGSLYRVQVKAIEVQSAGVQGQWSQNVPNSATIAALTENYVPASAEGSAARPTPTRNATPAPAATAAAPAPAETSYRIGQKGPAGGFVFYDNNPAPVSQATPPVTQTYTVGKSGQAGGLTFYDNVPAPAPQAPPSVTQTYTVGKNGQAGGLTFYDNEPKVILTSAPMNTSVTYRVGDKGPAGGTIFYVNLSATDGWRYLEAAPASTEQKVAWSSAGADVKGTNVDIGTGKQNTQAIVNHSLNTGENCRAAMLCDNLVSGGYDDWFLPSKGELNLMFIYLKEAGIGGFKEDWYWSSSASGNYNGAWAQRFSNGEQEGSGYNSGYDGQKSKEHLVRAIRQF